MVGPGPSQIKKIKKREARSVGLHSAQPDLTGSSPNPTQCI